MFQIFGKLQKMLDLQVQKQNLRFFVVVVEEKKRVYYYYFADLHLKKILMQ